MTQLWALISKRGELRQLYTQDIDHHPVDHGHRRECRSFNVWPLEREPDIIHGETVDYATGAFTFDVSSVLPALLSEIKSEAARRIEAIAPMWRQINDLHEPDTPGAVQRRKALNVVRAWSNKLEASAAAAASPADVMAMRSLLNSTETKDPR